MLADAKTLEDGLLDTVERVRGWCGTGIARSPPGAPGGQTHGTSPTEHAALAPEDKFRSDLDAAERHIIEATKALQHLTSFMNRIRDYRTQTRTAPAARTSRSTSPHTTAIHDDRARCARHALPGDIRVMALPKRLDPVP